MDKSKSFEGLLSEAPIGADEGTLKLVGALHRLHQQGKFMLSFGLGQSVTLDVDAVRDHKVIASSVGQTIVEIDIPRELIPREIREEISRHMTAAFSDTTDETELIPRQVREEMSRHMTAAVSDA